MTHATDTTDMMNKINFIQQSAEFEEDYAFKQMVDYLNDAKALLERRMHDLDRYIERMAEARTDDKQDAAEVFSWGVNEMENVLRNLNASSAVSRAARYSATVATLKAVKRITETK